jgi:hypothetical protein
MIIDRRSGRSSKVHTIRSVRLSQLNVNGKVLNRWYKNRVERPRKFFFINILSS